MWCCCKVISSFSCALAPTAASICKSESSIIQFRKPLFKFNTNTNIDTFSCLSLSLSLSFTHRKLFVVLPSAQCTDTSAASHYNSLSDFVVVNFYHFVFVKDPQAEVTKHLSFLEGLNLDIKGRVYLNEQGINAQFSGPSKDAMAYVNWLREDTRFSDTLVQISPSENGHAFPKLKLRYKPSLVQFEGGISHLPLLDPSMRATPLAPSEWRNMLQPTKKNDHSSEEYPNRNYILLDVRNG